MHLSVFRFLFSFRHRPLVAHVLEPVGSAIFSVQPCLAIGEAALRAPSALWRVGAVEEWDVLVADIFEPVNC